MRFRRWETCGLADGETMRLDRFLWFARLSASRALAQERAEGGHLRIDGRAVVKAATPVRIGQVLTFATHRGDVRVLRIERLPMRRGPPAEARLAYTELIDGTDPQN
jgi:ribosome-associated heat shock protein Hsp15